MPVARAMGTGLRVVARRDFWSFKVIHAVLGAALTVGGACGAVFIGDGLRGQIAAQDALIARADERIGAVERALLQFRIVQSNSALLGALASNEDVRKEFRDSLIQLMFVLRRGPALTMAGELYQHDVAQFKQQQAELDRLLAAATGPDRTKKSWDDVLAFEMTRERSLMDLADAFRQRRFAAEAERRRLDADLGTATLLGFVVQQIGFVVVLLAGLVHQYGEGSAHLEIKQAHPT